jgi:hypothetical protein
VRLLDYGVGTPAPRSAPPLPERNGRQPATATA